MADAATRSAEAKCRCGAVHFTIDLPVASLPLRVHLCHCSLCRYMTGAPCVFHTKLPAETRLSFVSPSSLDAMTGYRPNGSKEASLRFCSTCGCHIGAILDADGCWVISTSIFVEHPPEVFAIKRHIFNESAKGGGISSMLTHLGGREFDYFNPPEDDPRAALVESHPEVGADGEPRLRALCHCGGVSFAIKHPTPEVRADNFMSRFLSPVDRTRWQALLDVCDDCRLTTGTHVIGWTSLPLALCEPPIGPDLLIGTSKTYASSPGILRSFCGTCGATVFFSQDDRRPTVEKNMVDLATGILRAPEGVMAEDWLVWGKSLSFAGSGKVFDELFGEALEDGMEKWVAERDGKVKEHASG